MTQAAQARLHLAGLLRQSIAGQELSVYYQPKVNPLNGQLCGAQALLRWRNAELRPNSGSLLQQTGQAQRLH